jgi:hypothetical protein
MMPVAIKVGRNKKTHVSFGGLCGIMGGKSSRTKGFNAERQLVNICKRHGIPCKRSWGSMPPDLKYGEDARPVSVKRRKNGLAWAYKELETHDFVLFRADRQPWLKIKKWGYDEK